MTEQLIALELINDNPYQDREVYEDIEGLGRTIALHGLQQTPKARSVNGHFELEFGHRRKRAFDWLSINWKDEDLPNLYEGYTVMPLNVEEISDTQMFDAIIIENAHRADLKVTEKARLLRRYREERNPRPTSKEMGLVFNMNDATVRGMDIFLGLPEAVQKKLDDGTITQGTARTLHSMQKIANESSVIAVVKEIEKQNGNSARIYVARGFAFDAVELHQARRRAGIPKMGQGESVLFVRQACFLLPVCGCSEE